MGPGNQAAGAEEAFAKCLVFLDYRVCVSRLWKYPVFEIKVFSGHILTDARCFDRDSNEEGR